jgi:hypothetical protein
MLVTGRTFLHNGRISFFSLLPEAMAAIPEPQHPFVTSLRLRDILPVLSRVIGKPRQNDSTTSSSFNGKPQATAFTNATDNAVACGLPLSEDAEDILEQSLSYRDSTVSTPEQSC